MSTPAERSQKVIEAIFRDATLTHGLTEFQDYEPHELLQITEKGKGRWYVKDLKSGNDKFVYDEEKLTGRPEEIVRQLWLHKLQKHYKYPLDRMQTEKSIHFGREIRKKAADIVIYKEDGITPYIIIEVKAPTEEKGIDQLKSYLNSEGCEIGVWSNGFSSDKIILYRNYPNNFEDTLPDIPPASKTIDDLLEETKNYNDHTDPKTDLKRIVEIMQELVLANAGVDVFNEVFKLIYAKLYDEVEAKLNRTDNEILFRKYKDPIKTYGQINQLFKESMRRWPGVFYEQEDIRLSPEHLSIVVGELEKARLFGADLSIIDEAFEYLIPEVAKGKKGQYFTPRHVINMSVKMMNPGRNEYVLDPAAGSGGFLISAMNWVQTEHLNGSEPAKQDYAKEYLWGIDFADEISKVSRALMLIAGDGRSHLFKLNSLDPREWQGEDSEKLAARSELSKRLQRLPEHADNEENKKTFRHMDFDVLLTNPPFAGEIKDPGILRQYFLGKRGGKLVNKAERHILFIERVLDMVKPGGRIAIVLPQGVLNNTQMQIIRQWMFDKARILAVVGLHGNTFKPHTGTKTSVLLLQKWAEDEEPVRDYPIFMAVSQKAGKNNSGDYVYKKDDKGQPIHDRKGRRVLDSDLDQIADQFIQFAKEQKLDFWRESQ